MFYEKLFFFLPVFIFILGFTTNKIIDDKLKNLLQQFNINEETAKSNIFYSVTGPSYYIPNVKMLKNLAVGDRISVIESMGKNIKEYTATKEFVEKYNQLREDRKPTPPEEPKYSAQLKEEARASFKNSIAETEKSKQQMPKDQQAMFDEIIKSFKQQLADIDDPEKQCINRKWMNILSRDTICRWMIIKTKLRNGKHTIHQAIPNQ